MKKGDYMSIIDDLQEEALDNTIQMQNLLSKAYVVAKKLRIKQFEGFILSELKGYNNISMVEIPDYRIVFGLPKAFNPYNGWISATAEDPETQTTISKLPLYHSIPELESMLKHQDESSLMLSYPPEIQNVLRELFNTDFQMSLLVNKSSIEIILSNVRHIILDWAIQLENEGITGDGIKFSRKEIEKATNSPVINFYGQSSDIQLQIQQNSNNSTQIQTKEIALDLEAVKTFIEALDTQKNMLNLGDEEKTTLEENITQVNSELQKSNPNNTLIRESLVTIRNLAEGIAGNFMASGILVGINNLLG
jgi:hypothetical protein